MEKLSKLSKKFYERELRQYWQNKKRLTNLLNKADKTPKANTRAILYMQQRIENVETVIKKLNKSEEEIFLMIFKENSNWLYCKTKRNISKYTYYNVFNKSIKLLAQEFGEI